MMPEATNMDVVVVMDTKAKAAEADTISGAEDISVDSMDVMPARVDAVMIHKITARRWAAISVETHFAIAKDECQIIPIANAQSNVGDGKALGLTTIVNREAETSIKISSTIAKDEAVEADTTATMEADTIITMEVATTTGSSTTIKISGRDSRTMAMVAKIISSLTSSEL